MTEDEYNLYWNGIRRGILEMQAQCLMAIQCVDGAAKDECWKIINRMDLEQVLSKMSK